MSNIKVTEEQFREKIEDLWDNALRDFAISEALKKFRSGGVDVASYENNYRLPKIVMHSVLKSLDDQMKPLDDEGLKESKNLDYF